MNEELNFEAVLELIKECSRAEYITTDMALADLDIDPKNVIDTAIRDNLFTLDLEEKYYDLEIDDDAMSITMTVPLAELVFSINEVDTIEDMSVILCGMEEDIEDLMGTNSYDIIVDHAKLDKPIFTLNNSMEYARIDTAEFLKMVKERYGVQIEKASINKFNGTVEELCHSLTKRINRTIQFQKNDR